MLEGQANQFEEQVRIIENQINELQKLKNNLSKLEKSGQEEIYSEFGQGIFIKSKIEKKEILVDVGNKILVPKSFSEVGEIIDQQIAKFEEIKPEIERDIQTINTELDKIVKQVQSEKREVSESEDNKSIKGRGNKK